MTYRRSEGETDSLSLSDRLRILVCIFMGGMAFFAFSPNTLYAEEIADFTSHIEMRTDGTVFVQEEILYDFGTAERHGIYREIPLHYGDERKNGDIEIANISVTDENGRSMDVKTEGGGNYISMKIGDPDNTVTGEHLYVIRYVVYGAITPLPTVDELYWNVTGNEWSVPIIRARIEVVLPQEFSDNEVQRSCYKGPPGSTTECEMGIGEGNATGTISSVRALALGMADHEGVTIAVGVPKGHIAVPDRPHKSAWSDRSVLSGFAGFADVAIPLIVLILMWRQWYLHGRDPEKAPIIAMYEPPPGLTPMEAACVAGYNVDSQVVTAELVSLAQRGYFKIRRVDKKGLIFTSHDYALEQRKAFDDLTGPDRTLMNGFFGMDDAFKDGPTDMYLSRLKESGKLPTLVATISQEVGKKLADEGYYVSDPRRVRATYILTGIGLLFVGFFAASFAPAVLVSGLIITVFGWFMPKLTAKGAYARDHVLGLKRYLSVAEKDRLEFHNDPEKNPDIFDRLLPYALALDVSDQWAKQFAQFYEEKRESSWYASTGGPMTMTIFAHDLSDITSSFSSAMTPSGGGASGGGGFSGGGGGGGGGGSW